MDKLLSIIVPVYNAEKHLDRCVKSILSQTYGDIELILIDDGSSDACPAMCDSWAGRDWRVRVIHKKNNGASSARNAGLDMASGEYIGFVDADDFAEPDMYETLMKKVLENNADRSGCGYFDSSRPDEIQVEGKITVLSDRKSIISYSACGKHNNVWRSVYSKKAIGKIRFDESLVIAEDWLFNYEVSKNVSVQADTDKRLYHYESAPDSLMSRLSGKKVIDRITVLEYICDSECEKALTRKEIADIRMRVLMFCAEESMHSGIDREPWFRREVIKKIRGALAAFLGCDASAKRKIKAIIFAFAWQLYSALARKK